MAAQRLTLAVLVSCMMQLLKDLESVLFAHQVQVSCPLEIAPRGIHLYTTCIEYLIHCRSGYDQSVL